MQFLKEVMNLTWELTHTVVLVSEIDGKNHLLMVRIVFLLNVFAEVFRHFNI